MHIQATEAKKRIYHMQKWIFQLLKDFAAHADPLLGLLVKTVHKDTVLE